MLPKVHISRQTTKKNGGKKYGRTIFHPFRTFLPPFSPILVYLCRHNSDKSINFKNQTTMRKKHLLRSALAALALLAGVTQAKADQVTLAAWDFSNDVKYTASSTDGSKTYYTASAEAKQNMEYNFSTQQPFFYPTSGTATNGTLTIFSTDGSKKWYISNYNNGALRMYTASPQVIGNPTEAAQHYNYAEVELSATGYKNLQFSCRMSGNNSRTLPVYVLVSTDGGATWLCSSTLNNTGSSWSNFNETKAALAVDGQASVRVRALIGYDAKATGDMYLNSFKVTGEALAGEAVCSLTATATPAEAGYVAMAPVGNAVVSGSEVSFTGNNLSGYKLKEWQDAGGNQLATTPTYTTTITGNTAVTAVFGTVETYTLTVNKAGDGAKWGEVVLSPEPINGKYDEGTEVTLTVVPNNVTNFLTWETGSSELSRIVTVNGNTEVTATFDIIPFIVAWDFNNDKNSARGNRAADYAFSTDNTGVMLFYQGPNQASTNWGSGKASFGGKELWAARRYTDWSKSEQIPRAFVASFSVKDYDKINIHSLVAANNSCVRQRQLLQLSTTSATEGFETLKALTLEENPNSEWVNFDYELDTKAIDGMVYIRWIEDETSDFFDGGSHSGTEGFYLADVIIFADQTAADDTEAPQLVSSSPAEGSTTASARGNIVLSFNERVKAGTGSVVLNGETLTGSFGSKSVTYAYHGLSYGTQYTLSIGADAITDLSGNAFPARDITFTVMERPVPTAKLYDAIVSKDGSSPAPEGSTVEVYKSVQAAIDAAPAGRIAPWLIFVMNGEYEELVTIPENKPFIHLIGQDKEKTIISYWINNGGSSDLGWEYSTNNPESKTYGKQGVVQVNSTDFYTENISYIDSYGVERQAGPMGLAMSSRNDRQAFNNCQFRSYQDTWYTDVRNSSARQYVNNCLIEGAVDFYYGAGDNYIENSTFRLAREGSVIVAPSHAAGTKWGYVMVNNTIDGKGGANKLGRAWQNQPIAVWINTTLKTTLAAEGWSEWHIAPKLFAEYNTMDADGNPVDLNNRRTTYKVDEEKLAPGETSPVTRQAVLTTEEAAKYTYEAVTAGTDDWNPRKFFEAVEAPTEVAYADGKITWQAAPFAICYLVSDADGNVVGMTKDAEYATATPAVYTLRSVNEYGSLGETATFEVTDAMTTGIQSVQGVQSMVNGSNVIYNLAGQRVAQPAKGLYIVNGKKIVVK
jgi:pectin methylesterase-like acyl-CoA thioesterase